MWPGKAGQAALEPGQKKKGLMYRHAAVGGPSFLCCAAPIISDSVLLLVRCLSFYAPPHPPQGSLMPSIYESRVRLLHERDCGAFLLDKLDKFLGGTAVRSLDSWYYTAMAWS